ncbi:MAG: hypothetical protein AB9903_06815 [Vulcanimicrobiota bacterium]
MLQDISFRTSTQPQYFGASAFANSQNCSPSSVAALGDGLVFGREAGNLMNPSARAFQNQLYGTQTNQSSLMSMMTQLFQQVMQQFLNYFRSNQNNANNNTDNNAVNNNAEGTVAVNNNAADAANIGNGSALGKQLAQTAYQHATDGTGDGGHCFRNVAQDLAKFGINTSGASAYMAADQLASNPKVQEIKGVTAEQLKTLPAGAIVVWAANASNPHGHISVAMGDGKEASDIMRNQITNLNGSSFRVFMPKGQ